MNPFKAVEKSKRSFDATVPVVLATAFRVAHVSSDVWAALRFHRAYDGHDLTGYLLGCHFEAFVGRDGDMTEDQLDTLRELAWAYLEGRCND